MLQHLPEDVQQHLLTYLQQEQLLSLSMTCTTLYRISLPKLRRTFRCVTCTATLFEGHTLLPIPRETRPRRAFFELRRDVSHSLIVDTRKGAANFHVIRHLIQTVFRDSGSAPSQEVQAVRALRCPFCDVFVGFRHPGQSPDFHDYVHRDFVEMVDGDGRLVTLEGRIVKAAENVVRCAGPDCHRTLFRRDDMQPWSHVLASSRLTDMDPYLEWDHSWAGSATSSEPAFFVKRLQTGAVTVRNVRREQLRQGLMEVADAHCASCDAHVGWKIIAEVPRSSTGLLVNYDQVGRYGIIRTAVTPSEPRFNRS